VRSEDEKNDERDRDSHGCRRVRGAKEAKSHTSAQYVKEEQGESEDVRAKDSQIDVFNMLKDAVQLDEAPSVAYKALLEMIEGVHSWCLLEGKEARGVSGCFALYGMSTKRKKAYNWISHDVETVYQSQ